MVNKGLKNIQTAAMEFAAQSVQEIFAESLGATPIEVYFFTALKAHVRLGVSEYTNLVEVRTSQEELAEFGNQKNIDEPTLIIRPQAQLDGWRVDFLIHAYDFARKGGPRGWRKLIIECDGHDFHERTKQQAAKDRARDRTVQLNDYSVLRFTGSELYANAWDCAEQVTYWAVKGFP